MKLKHEFLTEKQIQEIYEIYLNSEKTLYKIKIEDEELDYLPDQPDWEKIYNSPSHQRYNICKPMFNKLIGNACDNEKLDLILEFELDGKIDEDMCEGSENIIRFGCGFTIDKIETKTTGIWKVLLYNMQTGHYSSFFSVDEDLLIDPSIISIF